MHKYRFLSFIGILSIFLFILPITAAAAESESLQLTQGHPDPYKVTFGLRLTGGVFPLIHNDFNDNFRGRNDYFNDSQFHTLDSEFELIKMGMDFGGEILIRFMPNFSIGIGAGYLSAGKETTAEVKIWAISQDLTYHPKFSAIPITLSFYYGIPAGSFMNIVLNAGFGYYLGTVGFDAYYKDYGGFGWEEETDTWSAKSNTLGFHGGIDLEFDVAPNVALVVGAKGRYAKLSDLTADLEWDYNSSLGNSQSGTEEDMTLWFGNYEEAGEEYSLLDLSEDKPTASYWSNVREAEVNLSGIVFQAGIKIFF